MQINRITLANNGAKNRIEKQTSKDSSTQSTNLLSTNPYASPKKMDKTPFGFFLTGAAAIAIYYAVIVGVPALFFTSAYAAEKISDSVDKKRARRKEQIKAEVLEDIMRLESKNPQMSGKAIADSWNKKLNRVSIEPKGDGNDVGLNKVIGYDNLQYNLAKKVLMPLCDVMDGKNAHSTVPNGLCLFGPGGTGKTHMAEALGEHYEALGGAYEKMDFTYDDKTDIQTLKNMFSAAEERYNDSGKKVYTMILVDDIEKQLHPDTAGALVKLTNNCKNKGVVFVSTSNDLKKISPYLLRNGRTDLRVPVGDVEDFDVADMINYNLKKHNMVHEPIDYEVILNAIKEKSLKFKPMDIQIALNTVNDDIREFGGYLTTNDIKNALTKTRIAFNEQEAKLYSDNVEYAKKLGGVHEY